MAGRVVAVVRNRGAVLCCNGEDEGLRLPWRSATEGNSKGSVRILLERLGLEDATIERRGDPLHLDGDRVVAFLVSARDRELDGGAGCESRRWEPPSSLPGPDQRGYAAVAPTVEDVAQDRERGSAALSIDALWALRDAAAAAGDLEAVASVARRLREAHPSMAALGTRIDRAMAGAETAADVVESSTECLEGAHDADRAAASLAAEAVAGGRVLTLSRSGTVFDALIEAGGTVDVLASRPGGEGLAAAGELADAGLAVSTYPDAAVYERLRSGEVEAVLVGVDAVAPDGAVVNKAGTWAVAHAAALGDVPCYAACAADKVVPTGTDPSVEPMFDVTPSSFLTAVLTDRGRLGPNGLAAIAEEHRALAGWRNG